LGSGLLSVLSEHLCTDANPPTACVANRKGAERICSGGGDDGAVDDGIGGRPSMRDESDCAAAVVRPRHRGARKGTEGASPWSAIVVLSIVSVVSSVAVVLLVVARLEEVSECVHALHQSDGYSSARAGRGSRGNPAGSGAGVQRARVDAKDVRALACVRALILLRRLRSLRLLDLAILMARTATFEV